MRRKVFLIYYIMSSVISLGLSGLVEYPISHISLNYACLCLYRVLENTHYVILLASQNTKGYLYFSFSLFLLISNPFSYILLDGFSHYCLDTFVRLTSYGTEP